MCLTFLYVLTQLLILLHRLYNDFGFTDTVLQSFLSYFTDRTQYVFLSICFSAFTSEHSCVFQGLYLCHIIPTICIKPLSTIIDSLFGVRHLLMEYSYRCLLLLQIYQSYFTLCQRCQTYGPLDSLVRPETCREKKI